MKKKQLAFVQSVVSLILCISMLFGTTFAWFTDTVASEGNIIASGNLDATMEYTEDLSGTWQNAAEGAIFSYEYWEPGYTDMKFIRVGNNGNLAFRYQLHILPTAVAPEGEPDLADVIDVYCGVVDEKFTVPTDFSENMPGLTKIGTLSDLIGKVGGTASGILLPSSGSANVTLDPENADIAKTGYETLCILLHMQESAGNEYQDLSVGGSFRVQLNATQYTYENDSYGNDYDTESEMPEFTFKGGKATATISTANGAVSSEVTMAGGEVEAVVPAGVAVVDGTESLTLNVSVMEESTSGVTLAENESIVSVDVHVDGVASGNTTPILVTLKEFMTPGLNMGNYTLYHVEESGTKAMTLVDGTPVNHNEYSYDSASGTVVVAMASFSEVAAVSNTDNVWQGIFDKKLDGDGTQESPYIISNADELAGMSQLVSDNEAYASASYKLIANVNFGGEANAEDENGAKKVFYPIGYWKEQEGTNSAGEIYYGAGNTFTGTFDGNGNTISGIYQNTWLMDGNYDNGYWKTAMGLFGAVFNATIKNLTMDNFQSDGEFTPTGCIAAYAGGTSTFENIYLTNCNPRVYNTGNGGIVGLNYNSTSGTADKLIFRNITVDQTNKISALWGSYDVSCGGILGRLRENSKHDGTNTDGQKNTVSFENCHVAAIMDVYNDVCANYQYYQYRYSGMMIGTVDYIGEVDRVGIEDVVSASDCTVTYGDWNEYWYCELVANSLASYTHDHQFSRLEKISAVSDIQDANGNWNKAGNFVIPADKEQSTTSCYHIMKDAAGDLYEHKHDAADASNNNDEYEVVNGERILKEDRQHYYIPFGQLFTGYGWGSSPVREFKGIEVADTGTVKSVEKFESTGITIVANGTEIPLSRLLRESGEGTVSPSTVQVFISPIEGSAAGTYVASETANWDDGSLTFTGKGKVRVTITDYFYCQNTTVELEIENPEDMATTDRFGTAFPSTAYLNRVGNVGAVALGELFTAQDGIGDQVAIKFESVTGASVSSDEINASDTEWASKEVTFSGTGVLKATISDNNFSTPYTFYLEVVDATNVTELSGTISGNVVLLDNCGLSSLTVSGRNTVYGNGFTCTYTGNGQYLNNGLKQGVITVSENGTLDNLRIVASIYPSAYLYYGSSQIGEYVQDGPSSTEGDKTRYHYQLSAVAASGNATISNCYIYGGRNNIFVNTGDVTIKNTILECGTVANVQIQSNSSHTVTLEDVTTIQYLVDSNVSDTTSAKMMGAGIIVGPETNDNPAIVLNGEFKQYNWVNEDDKNAVSSETTQKIIGAALDATDYNHNVNGKTASNLGIIFMNNYDVTITNYTGLPYATGTVSISNVSGQVHSVKNATEDQIYSDYENADKSTVNGLYQPQFKYSSDLGGQYIENTDDCDEFCYREGDTIKVMFPSGNTKELDLAGLVNIAKYSGQDLDLAITCKDSSGNAVNVTDGNITLSAADKYTVTYTVTDTLFYDKAGNTVNDNETYSWDVTVSVSLKDAAIPNAYFGYDSTKQTMGYAKKSIFAGGQTQYLPFLAGLKIYDYIGQNSYLRFDGDNDFNKIASAEITEYTSANHVLIKVTLTDGGVINIDTTARAASGGSTYTGKLQTSGNTLYYVNDGTTSATTTTWVISNYSFVGNNGVTIDSGTVTFGNCENGSVPTGSFSTTINYTVTYDANSGNCGQTVGYATSASATVTLPTPTRSGYIFAGWYTAASGGTRVGGAGESYTPSANITLYAQWGKPCTVTYDANGGSCGTASAYYAGTALTLPTATNGNKVLSGWYTAATGGTLVGSAGESYTPNADITLYAQWQDVATVTYNANGGSCATASEVYTGSDLTLPTPTRTGYKFNGWYTAANGGTKIGDAGASYKPTSSITLYAQWTGYTVTYNANNGSCSTASQTYAGTALTLPTPTRSNYEFNGWYTANSGGTKIGDAGASYTPTADITLYAQWSYSGCVTPDTLVTLAGGTQKRIDEVTYEDQLLVWDFYTGDYAVVPAALIQNHGYEWNRIIKLTFSDGAVTKAVNEHGYFDATINEFVMITPDNAAGFIGHEFVQADGDAYTTVTLVSAEVSEEYIEAYSILAAYYYNFITDNMFSLTSPVIETNFFMPFEVGQNMTFDAEKMAEDIEKYGLYEYADFEGEIPYEAFEALNIKYLKVAVGKRLITKNQIIELLKSEGVI